MRPNHNHARLVDALRLLGVPAGGTLVVHSSLRHIGPVEGGAETVLAALREALGPAGLLVLPTFTYNTAVFDPSATPSATGRLTEVGRQWPGAVRSWHPTHSVAALGPDAAELCAGHELVGGLALDSPLDRAAQRGGLILLLGVGHVSNSTVHVGEARAALPYLDIPFSPDRPRHFTILTPGGAVPVEMKEFPGCSRTFGVVEKPLRDRGLIRDGVVGSALAQLMPASAVIEAAVSLVRHNAAALLCNDPLCYRCTQARRRL